MLSGAKQLSQGREPYKTKEFAAGGRLWFYMDSWPIPAISTASLRTAFRATRCRHKRRATKACFLSNEAVALRSYLLYSELCSV